MNPSDRDRSRGTDAVPGTGGLALALMLFTAALAGGHWPGLALAAESATTVAVEADFYVATVGSDAWSGTLMRPNAARTDGPFATLERARDAARQLRRSPGRDQRPVGIGVRGGVHSLAQPLVLDAQDSGLDLMAMSGEQVTLSGGRRVTGWKPWQGPILRADLSGLNLPDLKFRELYYNGDLMPWARVPNLDLKHPRTGGFLQNAGVAEKDTKTKFLYREGELHPEKWQHPELAWVQFHDSLNYETQYCPVRGVDATRRTIEAEKGVYLLSKGNPFYVCGVLEELDAPGEWCVDQETQTLYFWPPSGDPDRRDQVVVPALASAIVLAGAPAQNQWIENVRIGGLALRDFRGRAIALSGARNCVVAGCDLRNAEVGVYLGDDTHGCRVAGCDITQTQGDGVSILGTSKDHERVSDHVVDNCYIWNIGWGRIHNRCGGVYMHRCARVRLIHNHVHDTPRYCLAMDVGNDCEFAYNYCHHANLVTADTGIIEAATALDWGLPPEEQLARNRAANGGNRVHHNLLHDSGGWGTDGAGQLAAPYYSWGIYLDTHCSNWHVHDNVVYNTVLGGFMLNCGQDNLVENNVFVDGRQSQIQWNPWPKFPMSGNRCTRNVFSYQGGGAVLYVLNAFQDEYCEFRSNLAWAGGQPLAISGVKGLKRKDSWEGWLKRGQDQGAIAADPRFVDPASRDYRLQPTSPALGLGFMPIDLSTVGNYASPERRTWPRPEEKVVRDELDYTPPLRVDKPQSPRRDYEDYAVGEPERNAHVGNKGDGTALVTDATAAGGRHSLKFTDAPGLGQSFFPYVTYPLVQEGGALQMSFDLRWEAGALLALDWRDDPYNYNMGPNLITTPDGWLLANGQKTVQLPAGQWVHVSIACGLGPQATGRYDLTLTLPGAAPQAFRDSACSLEFRALDCIVFMAVADGPGVFYLDNLEFRPVPGK